MSDLNFSKPIILVPTIIIGISVLGAIAYGIKSQLSGNNSVDNESNYSTLASSSINPSLDSYQSVDSNGAEFRNPSISSTSSSVGGSRKKTKKKDKRSKKYKKSKSKSK